MTILDVRAYITRLLAATYEVEAVGNGQEAMDAVLRKCPDLVIADVMMPVMDGMELLRELRKSPATATIPVILLSARTGQHDSLVEGLEREQTTMSSSLLPLRNFWRESGRMSRSHVCGKKPNPP